MRSALIAATALCVGCASPKPASAPRAADGPLDRVRISINSTLGTPDPHRSAPLAAFMSLYLMGGQLFRLTPSFSVVPYLAEGYTASDDGLVYTVRLRPGLRFSDGSPLTADDVVFAYERSVALHNPRLLLLGPVTRFEPRDDRTIVITLQRPYPDLLIGLADHGLTIFPKSRIVADPDVFGKAPIVSSGPFVLTEFTPGGSTWTFEQNPHFFGGPSMIQRVEFVAVPDETSRVLQMASGGIDYGYDMPPWAQDDLPDDVHAFAVPIVGMYHLAFNLDAARGRPLGDARVRQALSLAIDRARIAQRAFFGIAPPAKGFLYADVPEFLGVLPLEGRRDLTAARALLGATPYADGFTFRLQTWSQRPGWTDAALLIKEDLADLRVTALIEPKTDADAIAHLNAGTYEAQFAGNTQDPLTFLRNQFAAGGAWTRWLRYSSPGVTDRLTRAGHTADVQARRAWLHDAQQMAYADMPLVPIAERVVAVWSRVPRRVLCEANLLPGYNPRVATVAEYATGTGPCH